MGIGDYIEKLRTWKIERYIAALRANGLSLGKNVFLNDGFFLDPAHCHLITIEDGVTFGPSVKIFAHDASSFKIAGKTKIGLVHIKRNAFIGTESVVLPCSVIGESSIVAANSCVSAVIPDNEVWGGNPARKLTTVPELLAQIAARPGPEFSERDYRQSQLTPDRRREMQEKLREAGIGYMKP